MTIIIFIPYTCAHHIVISVNYYVVVDNVLDCREIHSVMNYNQLVVKISFVLILSSA